MQRALCLALSVFALSPLAAQTPAYRRIGTKIEITAAVESRPVILEIRSARNHRISKLSDHSPKNPLPPKPLAAGKDVCFPVLDVEQESGTEIMARFEGTAAGDRMHWNGNFRSDSQPLIRENIIIANAEHWENAIYVESASAKMTDFVVRKTITAGPLYFRAITPDWSGTVTISSPGDPRSAKTIRISAPDYRPKPLTSGLRRADLIAAAKSAVDFLLRSQNRNPASPTFGGLYLFYDLDAATFRRSDWIWTWGPAIRFLLDASKVPELAAEFGRDRLIQVSRELGEASLRFLISDKSHPAYGLVTTRFDPTTRYGGGHTGFVSPADGYFLAGWGWIPLFEATGDERFLHATTMLLEQTDRLLANDPVIEQDYVLASKKWKNWTMDESGFGVEGFAEAFRVTNDAKHQAIGRRYLKSVTSVLGRPDGLWDRTWHRKDPAREDDSWPLPGPPRVPILVKSDANTRGLSWAMMGLLAAHRLLPEEGYLEQSKAMAAHLVESQQPAGHWNFRYNRPEADVGIAEKGTAIWSVLFYRLHRYTQDAKHLKAARQALAWCMNNRYTGPDPLAHGGIIGLNPASGVVYRAWFPLICTYTMSFYGNALLAELSRTEK